jgi:peptide/nickel transport system permease protein
MLIYICKRLAYIFLILVVMSILIFAITQILPGNVAQMILGQFASEESVKILEAKLGLNDPFYIQYWRWVSAILHGDLGHSLVMEQPIAPILKQAFSRSGVLALFSFFFVAVIGILLGVMAAIHKNKPVDHLISIFTYLGISVPEFFWGILFIMFFSRYLGILPSGGYVSLEDFSGWLSHLILPVATLTFTLLAHVSRMTRSSMLETLQSQYVKAARAKGIPERVVLVRHALRNGLLPTITILAIDVGWLFGGIVVVETVFSYPGLGRLLTYAIGHHDLPLIQACILVITALYSLSNLTADLLYTYFNPRVRYAGKSR